MLISDKHYNFAQGVIQYINDADIVVVNEKYYEPMLINKNGLAFKFGRHVFDIDCFINDISVNDNIVTLYNTNGNLIKLEVCSLNPMKFTKKYLIPEKKLK